MNALYISSIFISLKLAFITTIIMLIISLPLAFIISGAPKQLRAIINTLIVLPIVLPPTVLGYYLLMACSNDGFLGKIYHYFTHSTLVFTFTGLVLASVCFSIPFVLQPINIAFEKEKRKYNDIFLLSGISSWKYFYKIILPSSLSGVVAGSIIGFFHVIGEFGIVLMVGGNIPGKTQVLSTSIYELVEQMQYQQAGVLSFWLLCFSSITMYGIYLYTQSR